MRSFDDAKNRAFLLILGAAIACASLAAAPAAALAQSPEVWNGIDWRWPPGIPGSGPAVAVPGYPYGYYPAYVYPGSIPSPGYPLPGYGNGYASGYAQGYGDGYNNGFGNGYTGTFGNAYAGGFGGGYAGGFGSAYPGNGYPYPY
jgi:hypothetical protein